VQLCRHFIIYLFFIPALLVAKPSFKTVKGVEGFESTFYSEQSGLPYLSILYRAASSERPKLGFLKFGISFLKLEHLHIRLDLRHAPSKQLLLMWDQLLMQKAIRYASMQPIHLALIDQGGELFNFDATNGKFTSSGELRLWDKVVCSSAQNTQQFEKVSIAYDDQSNALIVMFGKDDSKPIILPLPNS
jgi:hypothetical protein